MRLSYRNQLILVGALIAILATLVIVLMVVPRFAEIRTIEDRIADAEVQISQAESLLAQRQAVKARSAETEAERMRLANQMPENPELPSLIVELQDTVNEAGLEFASLTPSEPVLQEAGYSEIPISIMVQGTWADTVDLMQRLSRLTRQVRIYGFNTVRYDPPVAEDEEPSEANLVQTMMDIRVYTMPSEVEPSGIPPAPDGEEQQ